MATTTKPDTPRGMQPPDRKQVRITVPEDRKVRYGDPFWPKVIFQATFYIGAVFVALIILAITNPAPLQDPADPLNHAAIDPKPEWYFMFLFQLLKYFPGPFIVVGTAIIPGILTVLLILLPFYDRNWARAVVRRPVAAFSMGGAMLAIILLTWGGLGFPTPNFTSTTVTASPPPGGTGQPAAGASISPSVAAIFANHCAACHISTTSGGLSLKSYQDLLKGGNIVPGSVIVPGNHKGSVLWQIVQPGGNWPGGNRMPLGGPYLSTADVTTIAAWIDGLGHGGAGGTTAGGGPPVSFKKDVSVIFSAHCAACHLNGVASGGMNLGSYTNILKGGTAVPGPAVVPGNHAKSVLWQIIQPQQPWPAGNRMPLGGPYLASTDITTIATWIDQGAKNN